MLLGLGATMSPEHEMTTFTNFYNWTGEINGKAIFGEGETSTNLESGEIVATGHMQGMDERYSIAHSGASMYCISCSNSLGGGGGGTILSASGRSIVDFTGGKYTTRRTINHIYKGSLVGVSEVFGRAERTSERRLDLSVDVKCSYEGPSNILRVSDYVLTLHISEGRAFGRYVQYLHTHDDNIINFVECEYLWENSSRLISAAPVQNLGMHFREFDDTDRSEENRSFSFKAQGNNLIEMRDIDLDRFISSLPNR